MRRLLLSPILLLALVLVPAAARAQGLNILELYRELQVAQPNGFPTYEIKPSPRGPAASGGLLYGERARVALILDVPRFYLRITDQGDAESAQGMVTEVAAWIDADGAPLVGLSEWGVRDGRPFAGRLRFYSRASGRWNLVTAKVWPKDLDQAVCGAEPREVAEDTAAWEGLGQVVALLPRRGTDIQAWCVGSSPVAGTGAAVVWDGGAGRFARGSALTGPPPWDRRRRGG
ncbi:hypothetical protein V5F53_09310 [Xanthobacter sp. V4C-4]|uniref:hypothetical protein n=1 Tax=Xanthobacter cornucopiae TaxID=3119924 RepID=UPI00372C9DB8